MFKIKNILFDLFGARWKELDPNKDGNGKGTLERFNEVVADDFDDELLPLVDVLIENNLVPRECLDRMVPFLEMRLGSDLYLGSAIARRRQVQAMLHRYYHIRGTLRCYHLLFGLLGYQINIAESFDEYSFDSEVTFDDPVRRFDMSCSGCSNYAILLLNDDLLDEDDNSLVPAEHIEAFRSIITFNQPINAVLLGIFIGGYDYQLLAYENSYS